MLESWVCVACHVDFRQRAKAGTSTRQHPQDLWERCRDAKIAAKGSTVTVGLGALGLVLLAGGGGFGSFAGLPLLLLMFAAMYFLLIAPNQKKQKTWQAQLSAIKLGDRVTTNGGMRGTVVSLKEDAIVLKTQPDGVKFEIVKTAIAAVTTDDMVKS